MTNRGEKERVAGREREREGERKKKLGKNLWINVHPQGIFVNLPGPRVTLNRPRNQSEL